MRRYGTLVVRRLFLLGRHQRECGSAGMQRSEWFIVSEDSVDVQWGPGRRSRRGAPKSMRQCATRTKTRAGRHRGREPERGVARHALHHPWSVTPAGQLRGAHPARAARRSIAARSGREAFSDAMEHFCAYSFSPASVSAPFSPHGQGWCLFLKIRAPSVGVRRPRYARCHSKKNVTCIAH